VFISIISYNADQGHEMSKETLLSDVVVPSADDSLMAREAAARFATLQGAGNTQSDGSVRIHIDGNGGSDLALPAPAVRLLTQLLTEMGQGHPVTLLPLDEELTSQNAAELLKVSRPYLVKLLDDGAIPSRKVGTHRRVLLRDVLAYKQRDDERRHAVLDELAAQGQELGMGY